MLVPKFKRIFDRVKLSNWFFSLFCERFLDHVLYPVDEVRSIIAKHDNFVLAYVHRYKNSLLHIALNRQIKNNQLPLIESSSFKKSRKQKKFSEVVAQKKTGVEFFLKTPKTNFRIQEKMQNDVKSLIALQKQMEKPIILLPHILLLGNHPHQKQPTAKDMLFGSRREPGYLRLFIRVIMCHRWARWQIAEPVNLKSIISENQNSSEDKLAKQVRWLLIRNLNNLERSYFGPPFKSHARICHDTLKDKRLQEYVTEVHNQTGLPVVKLEKKAKDYYKEIAARFDIDFIRLVNSILGLMWRKISDGLVWASADIEKLKKASQKGPLIIVPSHRSHLDYVVVSQILHWEGLMLPHIAAGANLSFFPFGTLARRGGAFFIRRTFKGDPLYPQVVKAYVRRLLKDSFTQEFFIEGGRSRTGKTLAPKLGFLSIIIDCLTDGKLQEAMFMPASISYEKLVEARSYKSELQGGEKQKENTRELLKSTRSLKKKYGHIYVSFDSPISFVDFVKERGLDPDHLSEIDKRDLVKSLAHRIVFGMNHCSIITPSSLIAVALFGSPKRALSKALLIWQVKKIIYYIRDNNPEARFSDEFQTHFKKPIERALKLLIEDNLVNQESAGNSIYYRIPTASALLVDYYKNNILHYFVSDCIIATAFCALSEKNRRKLILKKDLEKYSQILSQIFKYDLVYSVKASFEVLFEERLQRAVKQNILSIKGDYVFLTSSTEANAQLYFASRILGNFVDAYWICLQKLPQAVKKSSTRKALISNLLEFLKAACLCGISDFPEIVSKSIVENNLLLFDDYKVLSFENGKPILGNKKRFDRLKLQALALQKAHYNR